MITTLTLLVAVAGSASPAHETYLNAIRDYASGEREAAVLAVSEWSTARVRYEVKALVERAEECVSTATGAQSTDPKCDPAVLWPGLSIPAALMLHTDSVRSGTLIGESHEDAARELAQIMSKLPSLAPFAERWFVMRAQRARAENLWEDAARWAERGARAFPRSTRLLLLFGTIEEVQATQAVWSRSDSVLSSPDPVGARAKLAESSAARAHFTKAERALQAALAVDQVSEARLRLARIAWWRGELDAARTELGRVLATTPLDPALAYLAHLFLGRVQEDDGEVAEALRSYDAAIALDPQCQSARLARSLVHRRLGDADAARHEVEVALQSGGSRIRPDPFRTYLAAMTGAAELELAALRREVAP